MEVRPARLEDAPRIAEIHVRSWQDAYRGLMPQAFLDGLEPAQRLPRWVRALEAPDWPRGGSLVVAGPDGDLAGFASIGPTRDEDDDPARVGEVRAIYLAPAAWGQGLGRRLMTAALEHLTSAGYAEATLWVLDANDRARRFYAAAGFAADGAAKPWRPHALRDSARLGRLEDAVAGIKALDGERGFVLREVRYRRPLP